MTEDDDASQRPARPEKAGNGSYDVGYCRPPPDTRFRKGRSGNPKGRPKGATGVRNIVNDALDETIRIAENGCARDVRKRQAILMAMIAKAIRGDVRAASLVMRLMEAHDPQPAPEGPVTHEDLLITFPVRHHRSNSSQIFQSSRMRQGDEKRQTTCAIWPSAAKAGGI